MTDVIEMMFIEMAQALGFTTWYDSADEWEGMEEIIISAGLSEDDVYEFFSEMAEEY